MKIVKYWNIDTLKAKTHMWSPELTNTYLIPFIKPKPNDQYLDVGSGFSPLGHALYKHILPSGKIIGIDNDQNMVTEANNFTKTMNLDKFMTFKQGDANSLDFQDNSFDAVMCQQLLVNLKEPENTILEMIRVSKKATGRLLIVENSNLGSYIHHPSLANKDNIKLTNIYQKILILGKEKHEKGDTSLGSKIYELMNKCGLHNVYSQYIVPKIPELNYLYLKNDSKSIEAFSKQQTYQIEIFKYWAEKLIPNYLSNEDWDFFEEKLKNEEYNANAMKKNLPLIQIVHAYSITIGWLKKQPLTQLIDIELNK